jgi:hypothetical protein
MENLYFNVGTLKLCKYTFMELQLNDIFGYIL